MNFNLFKTIISKLPDGIVACDEKGKLIFFNDTLRSWHGLSEEAIDPADWSSHYKLYHGDGITLLKPDEIPLRRAFLGETVQNFSMAIAAEGMPIRYCEASGEALTDEEGNVKGAYVIMHDVTTLVRTRNLLLESLENSLSGFDIVNDKGEIIYANRAYLKMWGYVDINQVKNSNPADHCEDPTVPKKIIHSLKETGSCVIEFKAKKKDGSTFDVLMSARLAHDEEGREIYPGFSMDLTPIKEAQRELRQQAEIYKTVTDNAASSLFIMDNKGHPIFMNPAARELTGYKSLDEIRDKPLHYAVHWKKPDGTYYPMEECPIDNAQAEIKEVKNQEEIFCRKDGTLFPVSYSVMPLSEEGEVVGSVLEFRDISEEKKISRDLAAAVKVRDEFLAIASHELKTPLTTLILQNQFHRRQLSLKDPKACDPERLRKLIDQNNLLFEKLDRLIEDMLDVSRFQSGKFVMRKQIVDLYSMAAEIVQRMAPEFLAKGYELPQLEGKTALLSIDPVRLEQVIVNLLSNALKYAGGSKIRIVIEKLPSSVCLSVIDTGPGITFKDQEKIFKRFERAVDPNEVSGLGLGLYISHQIIEAHGGKIWVESEAGRGAKFSFEIPSEGID